MVYFLLSSNYPYEEWPPGQYMFLGAPITEIVERGDESDYFTSSAREFLQCCLQSESGLRWTARELLEHPWIKEHE